MPKTHMGMVLLHLPLCVFLLFQKFFCLGGSNLKNFWIVVFMKGQKGEAL